MIIRYVLYKANGTFTLDVLKYADQYAVYGHEKLPLSNMYDTPFGAIWFEYNIGCMIGAKWNLANYQKWYESNGIKNVRGV